MLSRFVESYLSRYPSQAAESLERMAPDAAAEVLAGLDTDEVTPLLASMLPQRAAALLPELEAAQAAAVLGGVGFVAARRLLLRLDSGSRAVLLASISGPLRHNLERALSFPEGTVGRGMSTRYDSFRLRDTVRRVNADLARNAQPLPVCFVIDEAGRVAGTVRVTELIGVDGGTAVADLMRPCGQILSALDRLTAVRDLVFADGVDYLAVGDHEQRLIGVLAKVDYLRASTDAAVAPDAPELLGLWLGVAGLFWQVGARLLTRTTERDAAREGERA
jgi:magnesium transporter